MTDLESVIFSLINTDNNFAEKIRELIKDENKLRNAVCYNYLTFKDSKMFVDYIYVFDNAIKFTKYDKSKYQRHYSEVILKITQWVKDINAEGASVDLAKHYFIRFSRYYLAEVLKEAIEKCEHEYKVIFDGENQVSKCIKCGNISLTNINKNNKIYPNGRVS